MHLFAIALGLTLLLLPVQLDRALTEGDTAVKHALMKADLHPVRLSFVRWRD